MAHPLLNHINVGNLGSSGFGGRNVGSRLGGSLGSITLMSVATKIVLHLRVQLLLSLLGARVTTRLTTATFSIVALATSPRTPATTPTAFTATARRAP